MYVCKCECACACGLYKKTLARYVPRARHQSRCHRACSKTGYNVFTETHRRNDEAPGPYITIPQYRFNKTKQHIHTNVFQLSVAECTKVTKLISAHICVCAHVYIYDLLA